MLNIFKKFKECGKKEAKEETAPQPQLPASPDKGDFSRGEYPMSRERIKIDLLIHDLKVPLAVIEAGVVSLLTRQEKYGPLTERQEKVLHRVLRNTRVTQTLVGDALELGRAREGIINPTQFRLSDLMEQALVEIFDLAHSDTSEEIKACDTLGQLREALGKKGLRLLIDEALWCQEICMDETKIKQIIRNLLNNALKHRQSTVEVEVKKTEEFLIVAVKDDGEGIPEVYHREIFKSYFQMDSSTSCSVRGHGLGLAGVMVLVEDMGGRLSLESDTGKGAKFLVEMPLSRKEG